MDYGRSSNGRSDFMGGIDNEALDFAQIEAFISGANNSSSNGNGNNNSNVVTTQSHLPESPPDSGSEPPYSPTDLHGLQLSGSSVVHSQLTELHHHGNNSTQHIGQELRGDITPLNDISQASIDLGNELHVSHHLLTNSGSIYMTSAETEQQNSHINSIIHKHDNILLPNGTTVGQEQQQLLLEQTGDSLLELGHHRGSYRNDLLDLGGSQNVNNSNQPEGLSRLMPDVYHHQHQQQQQQQITNSRKRKLSQPEIPTNIKPEPGRETGDIQFMDSHNDLVFYQETTAVLSPICQTNIEPGSPNSIGIGTTGGSQTDTGSQNGSLEASTQNLTDSSDPCPLQCIRFSSFQQQNWHVLCDQSLQELPIPHYRVDADKGFNFSNSDDAFVCQKKNHFQITCHAQLQGSAVFVRTSSGLEKVRSFHLHFYGVKLEAPTQTIRVEQSQSDRSKKPFHPVPIDLQNGQVSKVTVGRLHFSETTSNNMRKKGRPNPEQRYFQLVVGLHAHTHSGHFPIISHSSERIIVRASNPGQFESDVELCWQRGTTQESIYHSGRVGINTDRPDESLVVHGNIKVSGHIVQPSDSRAKKEISELDTLQQLRNVEKIRVVRYRYEPEFAYHSGLLKAGELNDIIDTGVIAQEVQKVLPDAVHETGTVILANGHVIDNFLVVNKDRIYMETIGAVKELCKVTGSLETRIEQLEKINTRLEFGKINSKLAKIQKNDRTMNCKISEDDFYDDETCSNKLIQIFIITLIFIMAVCLTAISTLYFVEHHNPNFPSISHINDEPSNTYGNGMYDTKNSLSNEIIHPFSLKSPATPTIHPSLAYNREKKKKPDKEVENVPDWNDVTDVISNDIEPSSQINTGSSIVNTDLSRKLTKSALD